MEKVTSVISIHTTHVRFCKVVHIILKFSTTRSTITCMCFPYCCIRPQCNVCMICCKEHCRQLCIITCFLSLSTVSSSSSALALKNNHTLGSSYDPTSSQVTHWLDNGTVGCKLPSSMFFGVLFSIYVNQH